MKPAFLLLALLAAGCGDAAARSAGDRPVAAIADPFRTVQAGTLVTLDGSDSYDPDNAAPAFPHGVVEFVWTLSAPAASSAALSYSTDGKATFVTDVAGDFTGELVVIDEDGRESVPQPFGITSELLGGSGLYVFLTWGFGPGTDFDIHLLLGNADFLDPEFDCHYANASPDWGAPGSLNDPVLNDENDTPESLDLTKPQEGSYRVMVHAYAGADTPRVTIAHDGVVLAAREIALVHDDVWIVGTVAYSSSNSAPSFVADDSIFPDPS